LIIKKLNFIDKFFILFLLILLPVDFFYPTALIFKEAGAKPFNLFVLFYILLYLVFSKNFLFINFIHKANNYLLLILIFGTTAFFINFLFFDYPSSNRAPEFQFFSQFFMFVLFILVFNLLRLYFLRNDFRIYLISVIPVVVFIHLILFTIEFLGIFNGDNPGFIRYFRNNAGLIDRSSGLMSEPSYFGAFAGIFTLPLLFFCKKYRLFNILMAALLFLISIYIQAKTFFIVIFIQIIFFLLFNPSRKYSIIIGLLLIPLFATAVYTMNTSQVFNVEQNLSSAYRLGSGLLALNVASSGYGFLGIGFGQFHFFYLQEFSPDFLLLSHEALNQINNVYDSRASTFSLPIRILIEAGIFGLASAIMLIYTLFRKFSSSNDRVTQTGLFFISGSIGFLLTQDSYCLPSLALGLALVLTQPKYLISKFSI
jgi:hypothetical protein